MGATAREVGYRVGACSDRYSSSGDAFSASDIGWGIAYDDNLGPRWNSPEIRFCPACGDRRQVRPIRCVGTIRPNPESLGIEAGRAELECCAGGHVPGQESEYHFLLRLQPVQQAVNAGHYRRSGGRPPQLLLEQIDISRAERLDPFGRRRSALPGSLEQLGYDLGICLAVKPQLIQS